MGLLQFLASKGVLADRVEQIFTAAGFESVDDLAFAADDAEEVTSTYPGLEEAWARAVVRKTPSWRSAQVARKLIREQTAVAASLQHWIQSWLRNLPRKKRKLLTGTPRARPKANPKAEDRSPREKVAQSAVAFSSTWAPHAGLLKGC